MWANGENRIWTCGLFITRGDNFIDYVEVKATISNKDWFYISLRECQFALEMGDELGTIIVKKR